MGRGKKNRRYQITKEMTTREPSGGKIPLPPLPDFRAQKKALGQALAECPWDELRFIYQEHLLVWKLSKPHLIPVSEEELTSNNPKLARAKVEEQLYQNMALGPVSAPTRRSIVQHLESLGGGMKITFMAGAGKTSYFYTVGFASVGGKELMMKDIHKSLFHSSMVQHGFKRAYERHKEGYPIKADGRIVVGDLAFMARAPDPTEAMFLKTSQTVEASCLYGVGGYDILLLEAVAVQKDSPTEVVTREEVALLALGGENLGDIKGFKALGPDPQLASCGMCGGVWDAADKESSRRLLQCSACKDIYYCSQECQRLHWPKHKPTCRLGKKEWSKQIAAQSEAPFIQEVIQAHDKATEVEKVGKEFSALQKKKHHQSKS